MKPIGGFFELEVAEGNNTYHKKALALTTGRACFNFILQKIKPSKVFAPFYTCDSLLDPLKLNKIPFTFYSLDENLDPKEEINLKANEVFIYIDYFGLKSETVKKLFKKYNSKLILDNTQAFFNKNNKKVWSFNSARKYFGVPDGAYLYSPFDEKNNFLSNDDIECDYLVDRLNGKIEKAFSAFQRSESKKKSVINSISKFSKIILSNIDYSAVAKKRVDNFKFLSYRLKEFNNLKLDLKLGEVPFCYPFLPTVKIDREILISKKIFTPRLWEDVGSRKGGSYIFEKKLSNELLPLPIDQRYDFSDMERIFKIIENILK